MLECVIFDLDGLLIDSEPLHFEAYQLAFLKNGIYIDAQDWARWLSVEVSVSTWIKLDNLQIDPELVRAEKQKIFDELILAKLEMKPGAFSLIENLQEKYKLCIASSSRMESIQKCIDRFNLDKYFCALFSGETQQRSKPFPDIYQTVLKSLDLNSNRTIAIEDSLTGLKAARAANIKCVVCPDCNDKKLSPTDFECATKVVNSLKELNSNVLESILSES